MHSHSEHGAEVEAVDVEGVRDGAHVELGGDGGRAEGHGGQDAAAAQDQGHLARSQGELTSIFSFIPF